MKDEPRTEQIIYTPRPDASPETEVDALANVYRFILDSYAKKEAAERAPTPDGPDDAEGSKHDRTANRNYTD